MVCRITWALATIGLSAVLSSSMVGCQPENQYIPPPPSPVKVAKPITHTVTRYLEETGTTEATDFVDVRAYIEETEHTKYNATGL